jgi:hypothetical protein
VAETPAGIVIGHVGPSEEMIAELIEQAAYGARVLTAMRERLAEAIEERSRVQAADVLAVVDREIEAYEAGATREAWVKGSQ